MKYIFILAVIMCAFFGCKSKKQKATERHENSIEEFNATRKYRNSLVDYMVEYVKKGDIKDSIDTQIKINQANKTLDSLTKEQDSLLKIILGK